MFRRALGISLAIAAPTMGCDNNDTPPDTTQSEDTSNSSGDDTDDAASDDSSASADASSDASSEDAGPDTSTAGDSSEPLEDTSEPLEDTSGPLEDVDEDSTDISESDASEDAAEDASGTPVTWAQVHPIFKASCGGCHGGSTPTGGSGGHAIGSADIDIAYQAALLDADGYPACAGLNIAECSLLRIEDGTMPKGGGSPPDAEARALILQWLTDGQLQ